MARRKSRDGVGDRINLFRMLRDVLVQSMSKGQLPVAGMILLAIVAVLKMPGEDVGKLATRVVDLLVAGSLLGWALAIVFSLGWFVHAKRQRRVIVKEIERLSDERDRWQRKFIDGKVLSSED
jgi:hypothetical protein